MRGRIAVLVCGEGQVQPLRDASLIGLDHVSSDWGWIRIATAEWVRGERIQESSQESAPPEPRLVDEAAKHVGLDRQPDRKCRAVDVLSHTGSSIHTNIVTGVPLQIDPEVRRSVS